MRILRTVILSVGLAALATACGGKSKTPETVPDDTTGDVTDDGAGGDTYGGDVYGAEGGVEEAPAEGGE